MKLLCLAKGYASYGGSIHTFAADHLEMTLKDVMPTNLAIEAVAFIRHEGPPRRTLEGLLEHHILTFPEQVRARYRAKVEKLSMEYPSSLTELESFGRPNGVYACAHVLPKALDELSDALVNGLRSKPAIWRGVDHGRLTEAIEKSKASLPTDPNQILEHMRQLGETRRKAARTPKTVDDLDIEWSQYHPAAKAALAAPLFWSEDDDDAPHGNDTGSDLLAAFCRWNKRNRGASYEGYVERLLSRWGLTPEKAGGMLDENQLNWIRQEADIALAFAAIKLRGSCELSAAQTALNAIDKRIEQLNDAPDRLEKVRLLRIALQAYAV